MRLLAGCIAVIIAVLLTMMLPIIHQSSYVSAFDGDKWMEKYTKYENLKWSVRNRTRYEFWDWFEPGDSPTFNTNNDYGYWATVTNLVLEYNQKYFQILVDAQDTHFIGIPDDAIGPAPLGPYGIGAIYFAHNSERDYGTTFINQAFVRFKDLFCGGLSLKIGRFDYALGNEFRGENPKLNWLRDFRLSQRLIGPFGWSHVSRSYDGFQAVYDNTQANFTVGYYHPTQGGLEIDAMDTIEDIDLITAYLTFKESILIPHSEMGLFYIFYGDDRDAAGRRNIPFVDNRPLSIRNADTHEIGIHTLGFHFLEALTLGPGMADFFLWVPIQFGDWGNLDHNAYAYAIEAGYQFAEVWSKPWIRLGYFVGSGDEETGDNKHETFFQILPTARLYAFTPFYNLMNNEDLFIQLIMKPLDDLLLRTEFHNLRLNDKNDLWYMGAGATKKEGNIFGYVGRPSLANKSLANVWEITLSYDINENLNINGYYAHLFGKEIIEEIYRGNDGDFAYLEFNLKF
jgi:hypothetical protein